MIHSMTGFAVATAELEEGNFNIELRSVNHRYLDIQFRLTEDLRALEPAMRERVSKRLHRGKVECRGGFSAQDTRRAKLELNTDLLAELGELNAAVQKHLPDCEGLRVIDVLRWPGMFGPEAPSAERLQETALQLLEQALMELEATRRREGERLKDFLLDRVKQMEQLVVEVAPRIPELVQAHQEKLATRLKEAMISGDDERIRQELALFAQKIDVEEEISRLTTHLAEVRRVLGKGGVVGKRLDFLMQELNREANTLGSKSVASETSQASMELKVLIEQMREQIQNIE